MEAEGWWGREWAGRDARCRRPERPERVVEESGSGGGMVVAAATLACGLDEGPAWMGVGIVRSRER